MITSHDIKASLDTADILKDVAELIVLGAVEATNAAGRMNQHPANDSPDMEISKAAGHVEKVVRESFKKGDLMDMIASYMHLSKVAHDKVRAMIDSNAGAAEPLGLDTINVLNRFLNQSEFAMEGNFRHFDPISNPHFGEDPGEPRELHAPSKANEAAQRGFETALTGAKVARRAPKGEQRNAALIAMGVHFAAVAGSMYVPPYDASALLPRLRERIRNALRSDVSTEDLFPELEGSAATDMRKSPEKFATDAGLSLVRDILVTQSRRRQPRSAALEESWLGIAGAADTAAIGITQFLASTAPSNSEERMHSPVATSRYVKSIIESAIAGSNPASIQHAMNNSDRGPQVSPRAAKMALEIAWAGCEAIRQKTVRQPRHIEIAAMAEQAARSMAEIVGLNSKDAESKAIAYAGSRAKMIKSRKGMALAQEQLHMGAAEDFLRAGLLDGIPADDHDRVLQCCQEMVDVALSVAGNAIEKIHQGRKRPGRL